MGAQTSTVLILLRDHTVDLGKMYPIASEKDGGNIAQGRAQHFGNDFKSQGNRGALSRPYERVLL